MTEPSAPTFAQLAEGWLHHYSAHKHCAEWQRRSKRILATNIIPHIGTLPAEQIGRRDVARLVAQCAERGKRATANHVLVITRGVFDWGIQSGRIDCASPAHGIKRQSLKPRARVLS